MEKKVLDSLGMCTLELKRINMPKSIFLEHPNDQHCQKERAQGVE